MADIQKTVEIIFGGTDRLSPTAKTVSAGLSEIGSAVDKTADYLASFAEGILKAEAALAVLATSTLVLAVKSAGEFGGQIAEISTLTNATAGDIEGFRGEILAYSRDSKKSIDDINQAVYQAISLGIDYKDSLVFLSQAEKLSVAGRAELSSTTELLGGVLNAYGESVDKASKYSDIFFETVRLGKTTLPELAQSLASVTGIAANAGVPIETLAAAIAAITVSGAPTAEAIVGIKAAISSIIDPGKEAGEMAESLGIEFSAAALKSKGFEGVLRDVFRATGGNIEKIATLFGSVQGLNAALILGADKSGKFADGLVAMGSAAGSTETAYRKMADNFGLINQNLANNLKATLINLGEPLLESYGDLAKGISEIFKGLSFGFDAASFQPVFSELNNFAEKVGEFLRGVAAALPEAMAQVDFSPLIDSLRSLGGEAAEFFDGIDLTKPADLAKAIQWVVDSVSSMITVTSGIVDQLRPVFEAIIGLITEFNSMDESTKKSTGNLLGLSIEIKEFGKGLTTVLQVMSWFGLKIQDIFEYFSNAAWRVGNMVDILKSLATFDWEGLKTSAYEFWNFDTRKQAQEYEASLKKMGEAQAAAGESASTSSGKFVGAAKSIGGFSEETDKAARMTREFDEVFGRTSNKISASASTEIVPAIKKIGSSVKETKKDFDALPTKLRIAIELQKTNTAQFEAETKRLSAMLDFKAKIDIAQIEADTKKVEAIFGSINTSVKDTGDQLSDLFKNLLDPGVKGNWRTHLIEKQIDAENRRRDNALELQRDTIRAQIELMQARTRSIERGEAVIKISGEGLAPHLEAFMWEILEAIQIRASQEGLELLLGLGAA